MLPVLIVGAGLAGATLARCLADAAIPCVLLERRAHIAGLCYSSRDPQTQVDIHRFGPHIFHSSNTRVIDFVQRFDSWHPWVNRVKARSESGIYSMPINLHTINQLFGESFSPAEAQAFIQSRQLRSITKPANAEEQLLRYVGEELYEAFFLHYSLKQWGVPLKQLPADIVKRIPIRFNYNDSYFNDSFQALPRSGYTQWVANMLDHPMIELRLNTSYERPTAARYAHTFYTGPIDAYFDDAQGPLSYRTLSFAYQRGEGELQGCACLNDTRASSKHTRSHEHKYFSPWEEHDASVLVHEFSREAGLGDDPFYPKRLAPDLAKLKLYQQMAAAEPHTSFLGRLASYRYLDMHQVIDESLSAAEHYIRSHR